MTKDKKAARNHMLLEAARLGDLRQLESILDQFQQSKSKKKSNPLASLRKTVGPNNTRDQVTGFTCLHHAALNGHWQCVALILEHGAKVNAVDYKGSSALHLASWAGNLEVVKVLLAQRHQPDSASSNTASPKQEQDQQSPTGGQCNANASSRLLDIDLCNNDNQTALSLASQFGHELVVAELLANGANVGIRNNLLESPLDLACLNGRLATVDLLLKHSPELVADLRRSRSLLATTAASGANNPNANRDHRPFSSSLDCASPQVQPDSPTSLSGQSHQRRPSGSGWSALLRGRRDQSAAAAASQQSPLQRFTSATLSMRQRSPQLANNQEHPATGSPPVSRDETADGRSVGGERRRATLTVGASLPVQPNQQDWVTGRAGDQPAMANQQEQLLDHSPLHYATRRGHIEVLNLLLYNYQANIIQVTTMGSVLHEIAANNGKHSDMISLFFNFIARQASKNNRFQLLDRFLNLKNVQQKNVFEVLNEINNRSAQEIKRLIYEFSEQLQQQQQQQVATNSLQQNKEATNLPRYNHNTQPFSGNQQSSQQQQFSDLQQINSFVTMKRVPKPQRTLDQQHLGMKESTGRLMNGHQLMARGAGNTQSIDRRAISAMSERADAVEPSAALYGHLSNRGMAYGDPFFGSNQPQQFAPGQDPAAMTRSVSNLTRAYNGDCFLRGYSTEEPLIATNGLTWSQWLSSRGVHSSRQADGCEQPGQQQPVVQSKTAEQARKRRSKSRDLGSLLLEAPSRLNQRASEHLYDNSDSRQNPLFDHSTKPEGGCAERLACWPAEVSSKAQANHLVRSQTDCSHLMGRFFGGHQNPSAQLNPDAHYPSAAQPVSQQQATLDRKMINRHYHVYEHEFYPPRLLPAHNHMGLHPAGPASSVSASDGRKGKPLMAVVPPLGRNQQDSALRASVRSTASYQQPPATHTDKPPYAGYGTRLSQTSSRLPSDSRLSLNIDQQQQAFDEPRSINGIQQQHQMDRFLARHSRKSTGMASMVEVDMRQKRSASVEQQKRRDLVELQRKLTAQQAGEQLQERQHIHGSHSLESHLSEPHLFDSTKRSLMQDFDQMIGEELLSRDHSGIIAADQHQRQPVARQQGSSRSTLLTGVMLDMDRYGERITVSGTPVTALDDARSVASRRSNEPLHRPSQTSHRRKRSGGDEPDRLSNSTLNTSGSSPAPDSRLDSLQGSNLSRSSSHQVDLVEDDDEEEELDYPKEPPPKPPRLSLLNKQASDAPAETNSAAAALSRQKLVTSQRMSGQVQRAVIYDLPATKERLSGSTNETEARRTKRTVNGRSQTVAVQFPCLANGTRSALTKPPSVRPPPPPKAQSLAAAGSLEPNTLSMPLQVVAPKDSEVAGSCCSNTNSNSSTGSSSNEVGLLKIASMTSSSSSSSTVARRQLAQLRSIKGGQTRPAATNKADPDSGVCTSNSPASMSHDSEEPNVCPMAASHAAGTGKRMRSEEQSAVLGCASHPSGDSISVDLADSSSAVNSPPSPNTAQICIEEALMPLEKTTDRTTSPMPEHADLPSIEIVDRWLKHEADYENCQALQLHLQPSSECNLSIRNLFIGRTDDDDSADPSINDSSSSVEKTVEVCKEDLTSAAEDEDYAESNSEYDSRSFSYANETSHCELDMVASSEDPKMAAERREMLVKVLAEQSDDGQLETFYIDPIELKKIAASRQRSQTMDAETLTDEELCAAVDRSSGYIKFTLRKRRNNDAHGDEQNRQVVALSNREEVASLLKQLESESSGNRKHRTNSIGQLSTKKTRLNSCDGNETVARELVSLRRGQRHSFVDELSSKRFDGTLDAGQTDSIQLPQATTKEGANDRNNDSKSNASVAQLKLNERQAKAQVKQWFSTRLAGLVEYAEKFIQNGLDDVQYYNHPKLITDSMLRAFGIDNASHRLLIIDRITNELEPVQFGDLLGKTKPTADDKILILSELLVLLNLNNLFHDEQCSSYLNMQLKDEDSIRSLKAEPFFGKLLVGHRARLSAALDHMCENFSQRKDISKKESGESEPGKVSKQTSVESSVSGEVDMDASQASATSSSSKDSIRSIVSLKQQPISSDEPSAKPPSAILDQSSSSINLAKADLRDANAPIEKDRKTAEEALAEEEKPRTTDTKVVKSSQPAYSGFNRLSQHQTGSLVSEVARRLEAAAASNGQNNNFQRPIAATRRINGGNSAGNAENSPKECSKRPTPSSDVHCSNKPLAELKQTSAFVPVKSICWPPKKNQSSGRDSTGSVNQLPTAGKLNVCSKLPSESTETKSSANDDLKEEKTQQQVSAGAATLNKPSRPKPAPPAKPSKLVVSKFSTDHSQRL